MLLEARAKPLLIINLVDSSKTPAMIVLTNTFFHIFLYRDLRVMFHHMPRTFAHHTHSHCWAFVWCVAVSVCVCVLEDHGNERTRIKTILHGAGSMCIVASLAAARTTEVCKYTQNRTVHLRQKHTQSRDEQQNNKPNNNNKFNGGVRQARLRVYNDIYKNRKREIPIDLKRKRQPAISTAYGML